jgi:hypothetical protein
MQVTFSELLSATGSYNIVLRKYSKTFPDAFLGQYGHYHAHLFSLFERTLSDAMQAMELQMATTQY